MKLTDLTDAYRENFLRQDDPAAYEASRPEIFDHYHAHWGVPGRPYVTLTESELAKRRRLITDALPGLDARFATAGLDLSEIELILLVGQGTSNGHGMLTTEGAAAWLAVEAYTSQELADVFVTHEIAHALHYLHTPGFYFRDRAGQKAPLRQLITEGMATYLTCRVLDMDWGTALWADFLQPRARGHWMTQCRSCLPELAAELLRVHHEGSETEMFYANDPADILKFRAGYYLGLAAIETWSNASDQSVSDLLVMPRPRLETGILELLRQPACLRTA